MIRLTFLLIFTLVASSFALSQNGGKSDAQIISELSSPREQTATKAAEVIFKRGDRMIPLLLKLEGNKKCFRGIRALGTWKSDGTIRSDGPKCDAPDNVTTELAAIFLISAIFSEDIEFRTPPVLCDYSKADEHRSDCGNTNQGIKKAWESTKFWYKTVEEKGIAYIREHGDDPLENSGLDFY